MLLAVAAGGYLVGKIATRGRNELSQELKNLKDEMDKMEKKVETLETELIQEREEKESSVLELRRKYESLKLTRNELQTLADQLRSENTEIMNRATCLMEKYDAAIAENQQLKDRLGSMVDREALEAMEREMAALKEELSLRTEAVRVKVAEALTQLSQGSLSLPDFQAALGEVGIVVALGEGDLKRLLEAPPILTVQLPQGSPLLEDKASPSVEGPLPSLTPSAHTQPEPATTPPVNAARTVSNWAALTTPERMELLLSTSFVSRLNISVQDPEKFARLLATSHKHMRGDPEGYETDAAPSPDRSLRRGASNGSQEAGAALGPHPLNRAADLPSRWSRKREAVAPSDAALTYAARGDENALRTSSSARATSTSSAAPAPAQAVVSSSGPRKALTSVSTNKTSPASPVASSDGKAVSFIKKGTTGGRKESSLSLKITPRRMQSIRQNVKQAGEDQAAARASLSGTLQSAPVDLDESFEISTDIVHA